MKKILLTLVVGLLSLPQLSALTINDLNGKLCMGVMHGDAFELGLGKRGFASRLEVRGGKLYMINFNGYGGEIPLTLSNNKLTIANGTSFTVTTMSGVTCTLNAYIDRYYTEEAAFRTNYTSGAAYGYYKAYGYLANTSAKFTSDAAITDPEIPGSTIFNFVDIQYNGYDVYLGQEQYKNGSNTDYMDIYKGMTLQITDQNAVGTKTLTNGTTYTYPAYVWISDETSQIKMLNFGGRGANYYLGGSGSNYWTDVNYVDFDIDGTTNMKLERKISSANLEGPAHFGPGGMTGDPLGQYNGFFFDPSSNINDAYWVFDGGVESTNNMLEDNSNSDKHIDGSYELSDLTHKSSNPYNWVSAHNGGTTSTVFKKLTMNVGKYSYNTYDNAGKTITATLEDVKSDVIVAIVDYDVTHDVSLTVKHHGLDDTNGCYIKGTVKSGDNIDFVSDYQLFVMPGSFSSITDAGFAEAFGKALDITPEMYDTPFDADETPTPLNVRRRISIGDINEGIGGGGTGLGGGILGGGTGGIIGGGNTGGSTGGSEDDENVNVFAINKVVSPEQLEAAGIGGADKYSFFIKANYLPESGLEPTYHALTSATQTTGVEDILTSIQPEAAVEYFNLNGVRVDGNNLTPGIYVKRQGKTSTKVWIK